MSASGTTNSVSLTLHTFEFCCFFAFILLSNMKSTQKPTDMPTYGAYYTYKTLHGRNWI